jgi:hypothetical protein
MHSQLQHQAASALKAPVEKFFFRKVKDATTKITEYARYINEMCNNLEIEMPLNGRLTKRVHASQSFRA